jgi:RNA polymerase sigma-70 factor, ECF subfamily
MAAPNRQPEQRVSLAKLQQATDAELIQGLTSGEDDALAVIVDRYQRLVFGIAVRIVKDEGEAEDVVQIVFLDVFRNAAQFDPSRGTLKMWVLQYAYSRSVNRRRHLMRRQFYSRLELEELDPTSISGGSIRSKELAPVEAARLVEEALSNLTPAQRKAVELVYFEGLKFPEAAKQTGETLEAVRHHYYRGLMKIREIIQSPRGASEEKAPVVAPGRIGLEVTQC